MTGRRKGTPCGCDADPCGCSPRNQCIKTIDGQYPDANHEFKINAGEGISIIPSEHGITINGYPVQALLFKGTVGTGGTVDTLPVADEDNFEWMFIAISSGSTPDTPPKTFEIGDLIISNGIEWIVVPSGDDPVLWSDIQNKPTTIAGYGITDAVDTTSDQEVRGFKTFMADNYSSVNIKSGRTSGTVGGIAFYNGNGQQINNIHSSNTGIVTVDLLEGSMKALEVVNQRAYDPVNTDDVVTIGSLQASTDVVHNSVSSGNATINTTDFTGGTAVWVKFGHVVMVSIRGVTPLNTGVHIVVSGLPQSNADTYHDAVVAGTVPMGNIWIDPYSTSINLDVGTITIFWKTFIYMSLD